MSDRRNNVSRHFKPSNVAPVKNKNLAKISDAFRKSLDPISKRDVRELIYLPEDHVEKLQQEHDERRRAHETVFKNAVVTDGKSSGNKKRNEKKKDKALEQNDKSKLGFSKQTTLTRPFPDNEQNEAYKIIKEHMEYETSGGPPKFTQTSVHKQAGISRHRTSSTDLLRSDAAGKALLKYSDSHKKLQSVVNSFTETVHGTAASKRLGPSAQIHDSQESTDGVNDNTEVKPRAPVASLGNLPTISNFRRANASTDTLSRSMKTIGRASSVAQRLGTLMSRVALRNEAYEYEKQQQALQQQSSDLLVTNNNDSFSQSVNTSYSIKTLSSPSRHENVQQNPYEKPLRLSRSEFERPNVSLGVSKLDSTQFGKYVEEMKKVAEKAATSFEKFKERQVQNDSDVVSISEDDQSISDHEYRYQGGGEATAVAAAAAEIAAIQEQEKSRKASLQNQRPAQQRQKISQKNTPRKKTNMFDTGTSPREPETAEVLSQINRNFGSDLRNNNADGTQFQFIPDMSYTDQLMLQKLRKLKEAEGWGNSVENETAVGDVPDMSEIEAMIKRSTNLNVPNEPERASMGPISLNAILRSRLSRNAKKSS